VPPDIHEWKRNIFAKSIVQSGATSPYPVNEPREHLLLPALKESLQRTFDAEGVSAFSLSNKPLDCSQKGPISHSVIN
jgi:hypothetical protein